MKRLAFMLWPLLAPVMCVAACDPPPPEPPVGAAVVALPPANEPLPEAVEATVRRLMEIGATGSYRDMARLAEQTPDFRSNTGGMSHSEYWYLKLRTGDWPMAHMQKVLRYRPSIVDDQAAGRRIFVWPWMATLAPGEIDAATAREVDALLGEGQGEALRRSGIWQGYMLGVAEDGTWLFFISGAG